MFGLGALSLQLGPLGIEFRLPVGAHSLAPSALSVGALGGDPFRLFTRLPSLAALKDADALGLLLEGLLFQRGEVDWLHIWRLGRSLGRSELVDKRVYAGTP